MFDFYNGAGSFPEFLKYILDILEGFDDVNATATLVIANKSLIEAIDPKIFDRSLTVGFINKLQRVQITLVESLEELQNLLMCHFKLAANSEMPDLPKIDQNSRVIALYGIFEHFLKTGKQLSNYNLSTKIDIKDPISLQFDFMTLEDFSARTVNHLCFLVQNLGFYKKFKVIMCEQNTEKNGTGTAPAIWNEMLPNIQVTSRISDTYDASDKALKDEKNSAAKEVTLGIILSKWTRVK